MAFPSPSVRSKLPRVLLCACSFLSLGAASSLVPQAAAGEPPSWIFRRSQFSHDPATGARVAQYARTPPVEPLPDPRLVTSGYRRTRTNLRGTDGSVDSYYNVANYGNGLGGLDAEWERFHDAWLQSFTAGGHFRDLRRPIGPFYGPPPAAYPPAFAYPPPAFAPPAPGYGW